MYLGALGSHSPLQGGKLEALHAELDEGSQVCLADPPDGVDVCAGAVVLGQVADEAAGAGVHMAPMWQSQRAVGPATWGPSHSVPSHPVSLLPGAWEPELG